MAESITSGQELNSYQGNAALAEGSYNTGYSKIDFSPLERYALKKFEVNKLDYEKQQKDRAQLEEEFNDPALNVFLDKGLADQLKPMLDRQKQLSKMNLEKNPNSKEWYEFHDNYKELLKANAKAKLVQTEKEKYRKLSGETANPNEKKRMLEYADKLDKYKIGEEVPVYTKTFAYNDAFVPKGLESKYVEERKSPDGKSVQKVEKTIYNPLGVSKQFDRIEMENPEAATVWGDLAGTAIETDGIDDLNKARQQSYSQAAQLNKQQFDAKYKADFDKYKKANPAKTYENFLSETGLGVERENIVKDFDFLKNDIFYVPLSKDGKELRGFTYSTDPNTGERVRLNVDDKTLAMIHGVTSNPQGEREKILSSELSITPEDEFKVKAQKAMNDADNAQSNANSIRSDNTERYKAALSSIKKDDKAPELPMSPLPSIISGIGGYNKRVNIRTLPVSQVAAINPNWIDAKGVLRADIGDIEVSVGKRADQSDGIFVYQTKKKGKGENRRETLNESKLKSNAESWLATFAKERKGQEVYGYIDELYQSAKGNNAAPIQSQTNQTESIPTLTTKSEFDALPKGSFYYRDGKKYQK